MFSELKLLLDYFNKRKGVLLDVGSHQGSFSLPFAKKGWKVWAFEPEESNATAFESNLKDFKNVSLIRKAVSNRNEKKTTFYISDKHYGIHSLKPFHSTHKRKVKVETIKLSDFIKEKKIRKVDLLKIDIEGADFLALKGFDFKRHKPEIVMVEFMDKRTEKYWGYLYHDMVGYMNKFDYLAFISEWEAVKEYAVENKPTIKHRWLSIKKYSKGSNPDWGNIIFIKKDLEIKFTKIMQKYLEDMDKDREHNSAGVEIKNIITSNILGEIMHGLYLTLFKSINSVRNTYASRNLESISRIANLYNMYSGQRCFIIGNGPSLKSTDLSKLKNEYTFGLNRIYLLFNKLGFETTFLVSVNQLLLRQCYEEINALKCKKIISVEASDQIKQDKNAIFIKSLAEPQFSTDLIKGVWEGATVTYVAMQVAYYLGFNEVILIGVDHSFKTKGTPHKVITQIKADPNHFSPNYFKGLKWQLPDLVTSELAYSMAKYQFENNNREIIDATVGGKLKIFKKVDYKKLF